MVGLRRCPHVAYGVRWAAEPSVAGARARAPTVWGPSGATDAARLDPAPVPLSRGPPGAARTPDAAPDPSRIAADPCRIPAGPCATLWPMSHLAARPAALERYEAVIGIEVHCQVRTASKMFCACAVPPADAAPNTHTCPVCLALPGVLPTINRAAVEHVLTTGLAIGATAPAATRWDRKNYFYPDLPKGYQISQYDLPLASNGSLTVDTSEGPVTIGITRAHLEEDTAKLVHAAGPDGRRVSLVDFNRAGVPLMEIVTEPDIRTAEQARRYAEELRLLLRTIDVSDAEMENGQMRVEANVSLRPRGTEPFGIRIEVKNMNSLRAVERAIDFEIERQAAALDAGEPLRQETRGWDDAAGRDVRHAGQGIVGRLPLLPRAGPAAAPPGPGVAGRAAGRASRSCPPRAGHGTWASWASRRTTPPSWPTTRR